MRLANASTWYMGNFMIFFSWLVIWPDAFLAWYESAPSPDKNFYLQTHNFVKRALKIPRRINKTFCLVRENSVFSRGPQSARCAFCGGQIDRPCFFHQCFLFCKSNAEGRTGKTDGSKVLKTKRSPVESICQNKLSVNGESGFLNNAWPVFRIVQGAWDRAVFPPKIVVQTKVFACEVPCELCEIHLSTKYSLTSTVWII